ncbi:recombinase RecT [Anaerococcus sp. AGMB09787]|uniref:recombinase RecT n=1 Tax=Anaerococcus sp. AGMB09787 TaxID=2922869 RepID=UPI001FAFCAE3|nr:recombinase RecT [Anaerococcus sp. AGMB09787]
MTELMKQERKQLSPANRMKQLTSNSGIQEMFKESLGKNAGAFLSSLIEVYSDPEGNLSECEPKEVIMEALKAATLKLPINKNLGFAWIIPYNKNTKIVDENGKTQWVKVAHPQFQIGYKGLIQLAMRTGQYQTINANVVYEGMEVSEDYLTGSVKIEGKKKSDKVIGYFSYFKLVNGFEKVLYRSREQVIEHAKKHSQGYKSMENAKKGKYYKAEKFVRDSDFDEMAIKTMTRRLLTKYGVLSVEMQNAEMTEADTSLAMDMEEEANKQELIIEPPSNVDLDTGEIIDEDGNDIEEEHEDNIEGQSDFFGDDFQELDKAPF